MNRLLEFLVRRRKTTIIVSLLGLLAITPIIIVTRTYFIVHPDEWPVLDPSRPVVERQTESFTCGYHAMSTLYRAYGLDPERERVRWRLGVDTKAVFWKSDSTGAFQPDMFMVLGQDHFSVRALDLTVTNAWETAIRHLETGQMAILLIKRRENGNLHWVVATGNNSESIEIFDSMLPQSYQESRDFLDKYIISFLAIQALPRNGMATPSSMQLHAEGTRELRKMPSRMKMLSASTR